MDILLILLIVLAIAYIKFGVIIVKQMEEVIIERLGKYHITLTPGLNFIIPFIDAPCGIEWKERQKGSDGQAY